MFAGQHNYKEVSMKNHTRHTVTTLMKLLSIILIVTVLAYSSVAFAQQKSITLPKGTTVQKIAPGHFKFTLPNRQIVEVKNFIPRTGTIGSIGIIDPDPPTKAGWIPIVSGNLGRFVSSGKLTKEAASKLKPTEYIQIDDEVTWLPVTITYRSVNKLSPQPDPPGLQR
jgi:hypothetical protein